MKLYVKVPVFIFLLKRTFVKNLSSSKKKKTKKRDA